MSNIYDIAAKTYDDADGAHSFRLEEAVQAVLTCVSESQAPAPLEISAVSAQMVEIVWSRINNAATSTVTVGREQVKAALELLVPPASTAPVPMTRLEALKEAGQFISNPEDIARMIELAEWLIGGERS